MDSNSELPEEEMIHEDKNKKPLWIFLILLLITFALMWAVNYWQQAILEKKRQEIPFLQVTNRDFSLFLWQNPEFMRVHTKKRFGYLPHFSSDDDIHLIPEFADEYVSAPPEVIFRYHVWKRILGNSLFPRPIPADEFLKFLDTNKEWTPAFWPAASEAYQKLMQKIVEMKSEDLQPLSFEALPFAPRLAFQGWKNYFLEWKYIQKIQISEKGMQDFLQEYKHYNRWYWRNILSKTIPEYLRSFLFGESKDADERVLSDEELSTFLKIGFYNYSMIVD